MIVINMYIAIILENFNQAHQEEEIGNEYLSAKVFITFSLCRMFLLFYS